MKVLLIDPWGTKNTSDYLNGLAYGLSKHTELTLATNFYYEKKTNANYLVLPIFFKKSENAKNSLFRKIIRGFEYLFAYKKIMNLIKKNGYDFIHINWLLNYKQDIFFLKKIKKRFNTKIVYTAHNVLPHTNGEKYLKSLKAIYSIVDRIVLHGLEIKDEFQRYFPSLINKIYIQKHGCNLIPNIYFDKDKIDSAIIEKIEKFDRKFIFFGRIFYNKGIDRVANYWLKNEVDALLIIAGGLFSEFPEYEKLIPELEKKENVLILNEFVDDNLLNYLIYSSDMILLPYRHASMSGVVFTAADFKKTILFTDCGSIKEYLKPGVDSFVCENNDECLNKALAVATSESKEKLISMGKNLSSNINTSCEWGNVASLLIEECYLK